MADSAADVHGLVALFRRPETNDEAEIVRPPGDLFPIHAYVRWRSPGPGRAAINDFLAGVTLFELVELASAVVQGTPFELPALRELGERDSWSLTQTGEALRLERDPGQRVELVDRTDMLLALELLVRTALEPFPADDETPTWAVRARAVYPQLLVALGGAEPFEPAEQHDFADGR